MNLGEMSDTEWWFLINNWTGCGGGGWEETVKQYHLPAGKLSDCFFWLVIVSLKHWAWHSRTAKRQPQTYLSCFWFTMLLVSSPCHSSNIPCHCSCHFMCLEFLMCLLWPASKCSLHSAWSSVRNVSSSLSGELSLLWMPIALCLHLFCVPHLSFASTGKPVILLTHKADPATPLLTVHGSHVTQVNAKVHRNPHFCVS